MNMEYDKWKARIPREDFFFGSGRTEDAGFFLL